MSEPLNLMKALEEGQAERQLNVVLVWVLQLSPAARLAVISRAGIACDPLVESEVEHQAGGAGVGVPDFVIRGEDSDRRRFCLAFELKINAGLTRHQKDGYEAFLKDQDVDVRRFILVGPRQYSTHYELPVGGLYFPTEDFLKVLADAGGHIRLADIATNLKDHFVERVLPYSHLKTAVHDGLRNGEVDTPLWQLGQELKGLVGDSTEQKAAAGPARWGGKRTRHPYYGFHISVLEKGEDVASNVAWIGFWSYEDDDHVDLYGQISNPALVDALAERGHELVPGRDSADSLWRLPLRGQGDIRASTIMEAGLEAFVQDVVQIIGAGVT